LEAFLQTFKIPCFSKGKEHIYLLDGEK